MDEDGAPPGTGGNAAAAGAAGAGAGAAGGGGSGHGGGSGVAGVAGVGGAGSGGVAGKGGTNGGGSGAAGGTAGAAGIGGGGGAGHAGTAGTSGASGTAGTTNTGGAGGKPPATDCPRVKVHTAGGNTLNVRPQPNTNDPPVGQLNNGDIVDVVQQVTGEIVSGNDLWFQIAAPSVKGYVSAVFATCTTETPLQPPDGYYLPLPCGKKATISQGNNGGFSHVGNIKYAFDFSLGLNSSMRAMADGTVAYLFDKTKPGDKCYNGGGSECYPYANYVVLRHGDGKLTTYKHLNKVSVKLGQKIARGTEVGLSGSTGYSTGPHAHVMRMEDCGQYSCVSIPLKFVDVPGSGVPNTGDSVTSKNCP